MTLMVWRGKWRLWLRWCVTIMLLVSAAIYTPLGGGPMLRSLECAGLPHGFPDN